MMPNPLILLSAFNFELNKSDSIKVKFKMKNICGLSKMNDKNMQKLEHTFRGLNITEKLCGLV